MIKGFKEFIAQGNALELAVAVIIGAAFKPIVDAITDVIMTIIGQLIGSPNFDSLGAFSLYDNGSYTWSAWCFSDWGSFSFRESIGWRPCQQRNTQTSSRPKWCVR